MQICTMVCTPAEENRCKKRRRLAACEADGENPASICASLAAAAVMARGALKRTLSAADACMVSRPRSRRKSLPDAGQQAGKGQHDLAVVSAGEADLAWPPAAKPIQTESWLCGGLAGLCNAQDSAVNLLLRLLADKAARGSVPALDWRGVSSAAGCVEAPAASAVAAAAPTNKPSAASCAAPREHDATVAATLQAGSAAAPPPKTDTDAHGVAVAGRSDAQQQGGQQLWLARPSKAEETGQASSKAEEPVQAQSREDGEPVQAQLVQEQGTPVQARASKEQGEPVQAAPEGPGRGRARSRKAARPQSSDPSCASPGPPPALRSPLRKDRKESVSATGGCRCDGTPAPLRANSKDRTRANRGARIDSRDATPTPLRGRSAERSADRNARGVTPAPVRGRKGLPPAKPCSWMPRAGASRCSGTFTVIVGWPGPRARDPVFVAAAKEALADLIRRRGGTSRSSW